MDLLNEYGGIIMNKVALKVLNNAGNENANPLTGIVLMESEYSFINHPKMKSAVKNSIIASIEKYHDFSIEWLADRIEGVMSGKNREDSFFIGDIFYRFSF